MVEKATSDASVRPGLFTRFANDAAFWMGRPIVFSLALATVLLWAALGPMYKYSDTWQLVINTGTTIVTFLMVFLIQHSQTRDTLAIQIKLSELVLAQQGAENRLARVEDLSDEEMERLQQEYRRRAESMEDGLADRRKARARTKPRNS
jgi:low affinity Fe/Cu permease